MGLFSSGLISVKNKPGNCINELVVVVVQLCALKVAIGTNAEQPDSSWRCGADGQKSDEPR